MLNADFSRRARKFLEKCENELAKRLVNALDKLRQNPFPSDAKRVENQWFESEKVFRIRVGDCRVLYSVNYAKNRLIIVKIDTREHAYE
jgi:mRNA-degrading endonuclease RelE of RelBE toxin-antitoxin system